MQSKATTVARYLKELPADRRKAITAIRAAVKKNLPKGYKETMQYGMIGYVVPHSLYPDGYHCKPEEPLPYAHIASQKNHMAVYMMCVYGDETIKKWFMAEWKKTGLKLDMGKSCIRFKKIEDIPVDLIGKAIGKVSVKKFVEFYESQVKGGASKRPKAKKKAATAKKKSARKAARKRA